MSALVQALQILSGLLWLLPALYLTPRIIASWRKGASRATLLSAPIGFLSWLQVGFIVRWIAWPHALAAMRGDELLTWAALYGMSGGLALWFLSGAIKTRGE
jgi:hypothetical protein